MRKGKFYGIIIYFLNGFDIFDRIVAKGAILRVFDMIGRPHHIIGLHLLPIMKLYTFAQTYCKSCSTGRNFMCYREVRNDPAFMILRQKGFIAGFLDKLE